jgi:iron complex transport system ATP-binding protein
MRQAIRADKLNFAYSGNSKNNPDKDFTISDITLTVNEGDFVSVIGKNGSGKSTLVKLISKIITGYSGDIYFFERDIREIFRKEFSGNVSYLPQTAAMLSEELTVFEMLLLGRYSYKKFTDFNYTKQDRETVNYCMNETGIKKMEDRYLNQLSGGEKQKVLLTLGLVQLNIENNPSGKILIIDEPLTYLDVNYQMEIFSILKKLNEKGLTVIIVIHDLSLALNFTGKSILMVNGRAVKYSDSREVITEEVLKEHFLIDSKIVSYDNKFAINYAIKN